MLLLARRAAVVEPNDGDCRKSPIAKKIKDHPVYPAVRTQDANGLRKLAANARSTEQRVWLQLLAEIVEDRVENDIRQRRRFAR